ncbi:hypothetical protein FVEG_11716 [Fusarium verticillioides 7600]|uniref:Uncharacterized protein n=1 Tax=Gibberella moniliformis (strain M3125 / FGSC 7600) TaxID=334819 RepID=W7MP50_GIBM7|nr:hypothetical protein FVEG_11716 [Fusarium verticillioides 7600]EWG53243.1 hypothetical protein FVEG_11716 [Fusarium verticillioides 7600]
MAEALGTASAIITIWDLVVKAKKMHDQIKTAPGTWKLYCDGLESLAHVQIVIKDLVQSTPQMAIPMIQLHEGETKDLVSFVNDNLEIVRKQATNILDQHDLATNRSTTANKFFEWLRIIKKSYMFILDEQEIGSLREAVESAKSTLQLALQLLFTNKFFSGEQRMHDELKNIHDSMKKQAGRLKSIEKNRKLSQIPLKLNCGKVSASRGKRIKAAALRFGRLTNKTNHAFEALLDSGTVTVTQLVETEAQLSPGTESQVFTLEKQDEMAQKKGGTQDTDATDARADKSDANDEGADEGDDRSSLSKPLIVVRREKPQTREYDFVWRDGDIFSIRTDTDMYRAAFEARIGDYQTIPMFTLDYILENLPDAQQGQDAPTEDGLEDFLALDMPSPDESDVEPINETFSTPIDCKRPTYAFVGHGIDTYRRISDTTTSLPFCVWVVCDLQACQIFALQNPCRGASRSCNRSVFDNVSEGRTDVRHTMGKKGAVSSEACCVRPVTLKAWLDEDVVEEEAVTSTDDGASYEESNSVYSTIGKDHDRGHDDHDYDERALDLLQAVMTRMPNGSDVPDRIELDVLVGYIKVVDKQKPIEREFYLPQAWIWADALLPNMSTSFDEDAIAWLWILWRFHMPTEFRKLSAIVAQQATGRIGPEHDRHGVEIPESIIGT